MHSQQAKTVIDPVRFEVVRNALIFAAEEMAVALRRSAYSTNIKTRADFSCGLFDKQLRTVAQSFAQPNHLGSLAKLVPWAIREYGVDNMGPGDGIVVNDPFHGGGHLNDITLITPIHHRDKLIGFAANSAHHVDVGGGAPASLGAFREIYQEGIQIPPVKLVHEGTIDPDTLALILAQIRSTRETTGDIRAQVAANNTGIRRLGELFERLGHDQILTYIDELIAYTERRARAEIAELPKGIFDAVGFLDDDGFSNEPVRLQVQVGIHDDDVRFDLSGSDKQRPAPVNSTYAQSFAACAYALICIIGPDIPVNDGLYQVLTVQAPEGTVVNATHPAPVVGGWEVSNRLTDVIFRAMSQPLPKKVPAGTKGMICHAGFGGIDPRTGEFYSYMETVSGGYGGRYGKDGPDAVQTHGQNTENAPVEETELYYPIRVLRYELVPDSEGSGRWRGGLGVRRDYWFPDHEVSFTILADRAKQAPWGLFGGQPARLAEYILNPDDEARRLGTKMTLQLKPGDVVSYRTCGGGGYGNPLERDPALVVDDVRQGKVRLERARTVYGVEVDPTTWRYDPDETKRLRSLATTERNES